MLLFIAVLCSMGLLRDGGSDPTRSTTPVLTPKLDDQFAIAPKPTRREPDQRGQGGRGGRKQKAGMDVLQGLNMYNGIDLPPNIDSELDAAALDDAEGAEPLDGSINGSNSNNAFEFDLLQQVGRQTTTRSPQANDTGQVPTEVNVIIIAEGRTGSSLLLSLLSLTPGSFPLFEPFKRFKYHGDPPMNGTFHSLFSCKFAQDNRILTKVLWPGLPRTFVNATMLDTDVVKVKDWRHHFVETRKQLTMTDSKLVGRKCRESPVKIIKTIRFTGYVRNIPEEVKGNVKVIHILRHPSDTIASQSHLGWHPLHNMSGNASVAAEHSYIRDLCTRVDSGIKVVMGLPRQNIHFIRYEDLVRSPTAVTRIAFDFLGVRPPKDLGTRVKALMTEEQGPNWKPKERFKHEEKGKNEKHLDWPSDLVLACSQTLQFGGYL